MPLLTEDELKWIVDLTGDGAGAPGALENEENGDNLNSTRKEKFIDQMTTALDRVRDAIKAGEDYELTIKGKGLSRDKKARSIQPANKTFDEVETQEDMKKAELLSEQQQKKIFEA